MKRDKVLPKYTTYELNELAKEHLILIGEGPAETRALSFYIYAETAEAFMEVIAL